MAQSVRQPRPLPRFERVRQAHRTNAVGSRRGDERPGGDVETIAQRLVVLHERGFTSIRFVARDQK